jgi:hypothetical protein
MPEFAAEEKRVGLHSAVFPILRVGGKRLEADAPAKTLLSCEGQASKKRR